MARARPPRRLADRTADRAAADAVSVTAAPLASATTPTAPTARRPALAATLALVLLALLAYGNALRGEFLYDDLPYITDNPQVQQPTVTRLLLEPLTDRPELGLHRPLPLISYALQAGGRGRDAPTWPFHALNVALHAGVTLLVAALARRLCAGPGTAWLAAALFAVHPCHLEAVVWIVGRAELLAALFGLGYLVLELREPRSTRTRIGAVLLLFLAGASKESAFVLPGVAVALQLALAGEKRPAEWAHAALRQWPAALALALLLVWRFAAMGTLAPNSALATYRHLALFERLGVALQLLGEYFLRALLPLTPRLFFHESEFSQLRPLALLGLAGWLSALAWARRRPTLRAALLAFPLTLATVLNVVPIQESFAQRFLYLPSAFALLLPASLLAALVERERVRRGRIGLSLVAPAAALLLLLGTTLRFNPLFDRALTLWRHNVAQAPDVPFVHYQFAYFLHDHGLFLRRDAETPGALDEYEAALAANQRIVARGERGMPPDQLARAWLSIGAIQRVLAPPARRNPRRAKEALERAIAIGEQVAQLDLELARALYHYAQLRPHGLGITNDVAERALRRALQLTLPAELRQNLEEELARVLAERAAPPPADGG